MTVSVRVKLVLVFLLITVHHGVWGQVECFNECGMTAISLGIADNITECCGFGGAFIDLFNEASGCQACMDVGAFSPSVLVSSSLPSFGSNGFLECTADSGLSTSDSDIQWLGPDGAVLVSMLSVSNLSLSFAPLETSDIGTYTCVSQFTSPDLPGLTATLSSTATIIPGLGVPTPTAITSSTPRPTAGDPFTLTCTVNMPGQNISWIDPSGNSVVTGDDVTVVTNTVGSETVSVLSFPSVSTFDTGRYTCVAPEPLSTTVIVDIPLPIVSITGVSTPPMEGSPYEPLCEGEVPDGLNGTVIVTWRDSAGSVLATETAEGAASVGLQFPLFTASNISTYVCEVVVVSPSVAGPFGSSTQALLDPSGVVLTPLGGPETTPPPLMTTAPPPVTTAPDVTTAPATTAPPTVTTALATTAPPTVTTAPDVTTAPPTVTTAPATTAPPTVTTAPDVTTAPPTVTTAPATTAPPTVTTAPATTAPPTVTTAPATTAPPTVTTAPATTAPPTVTTAPATTAPPTVTTAPATTVPPTVTTAPVTTAPPTVTTAPATTVPPTAPATTAPPTVTTAPEPTSPPVVDECALRTDNCNVQSVCTYSYINRRLMRECRPVATCTDTVDGFECSCNTGFMGNGVFCRDINECSAGTDGCHPNARCSNTVGGYRCRCRPGFLGDGERCCITSQEILTLLSSDDDDTSDSSRSHSSNSHSSHSSRSHSSKSHPSRSRSSRSARKSSKSRSRSSFETSTSSRSTSNSNGIPVTPDPACADTINNYVMNNKISSKSSKRRSRRRHST